MNSRVILSIVLYLLGASLSSQQTTYTVVPNIDDTFDYAGYTFLFNNRLYVERSTVGPISIFYNEVHLDGSLSNHFVLNPKLGSLKETYFSTQIGSKLFMVGVEHDTNDFRGNLAILNDDLSIFRDTVFYGYISMSLDVCRYDKKRNKVISLFSYVPHKDSLNTRYWGIMEFDTLGNLLRKKEINPIAKYNYADNLLITSDGNYLVSGKLNNATMDMDPFFVKLDTNFNEIWRADLMATGEKFLSQYYSESLLELPDNKGYVYLGTLDRPLDTLGTYCKFIRTHTSLSFITPSGQITRNYFHKIDTKNCEGNLSKGIFLKNDSMLIVFTQTDTTSTANTSNKDSASSLVIHYNFNQHRVVKEIIGGQLVNGKTSWILPGFSGGCFRTHVGRDVDGGFITSGWASINDDQGNSAYLMKTDSCGYTQDHICKLVYEVGARIGKTVQFHVIDSLSVLCQPIWTIEGQKYTNLDVTHTFSTYGKHTIKLWGFAGSTVDSLEFEITIDSTGSSVQVIEKNQIVIYPNPTKDYIIIQSQAAVIPNLIRNLNISVYDVFGREMLNQVQHDVKGDMKLNLKDIPTGVYLLKITDKDSAILKAERLVIQRD